MINFDGKLDVSVHSNSKGNLLKTEYTLDGVTYFVKSGRMQLRDHPGKWGIEPVVEVICARLGKIMGLDMALQELNILKTVRYHKDICTLACVSPDFRNNKQLIYLSTLYIQNSNCIDMKYLCRMTDGTALMDLLAFDLIIMNEDRHNGNIAWLQNDDMSLTASPIYDNGYSLLYDDIKGMLKDFRHAVKFCLCNSPLYNENFGMAEKIFAENSRYYRPDIRLDVGADEIKRIISDVKNEYMLLVKYNDVNNVEIPDIWWERVSEFIRWRMCYVRDLRDNMER